MIVTLCVLAWMGRRELRRARPATGRQLDDLRALRRKAGESEDVDGEGLTLEQAAVEVDRFVAPRGRGDP